MYSRSEFDDDDLRREAMEERRAHARLWHWCSECHGNTGPGSPCAIEPEPEDEPEEEADEGEEQ